RCRCNRGRRLTRCVLHHGSPRTGPRRCHHRVSGRNRGHCRPVSDRPASGVDCMKNIEATSEMFPEQLMKRISSAGVIAVLTIDDPVDAVPLARALVMGGVTGIEL